MRSITLFFSLVSMIAWSQNPIIIPGTIESTNVNLTLQNGTFEFFPGQTTTTMGVNGPILGPTLIMNKGDNMNINITNSLGEDTTIHWHGMHVSAANDGGPHTVIGVGDTWNPQFEVMDKAGTYWYHPHLLNHTDEHASKGISGFIIVRDSEEAALTLPRTYGVDDFPLAVQTKSFDASYQIKHSVNDDTSLMVNATINGQLDVPAQVVRLRLLNGSSQRTFNFGLSGNNTFHLIGTDGGLLNAPVALTRLPLSPGARAEILINLTGLQGQTLQLMSYASELANGNYGATYPGNTATKVLDNYNPNTMNGTDFNVLQLDVVAQTASPVTSIPTTLVNDIPLLEADADETRNFTFSPLTGGINQLNGDFAINNVTMDMNVINVTVPLNNTEIWTFQNNSAIAHPFHMHDVQFYILDINGSTPPSYLQGRKDTFMIPSGGSARIITKFENHADDTIPYMYHCHMLKHEDALAGMMGQFVVVDQTAGLDDDTKIEHGVLIHPNPSKGAYVSIHLENPAEKILAYSVINSLGQIISHHKIHENELSNMYSFPVFELAQGQYFVKVFTENTIVTKKFTKHH